VCIQKIASKMQKALGGKGLTAKVFTQYFQDFQEIMKIQVADRLWQILYQ